MFSLEPRAPLPVLVTKMSGTQAMRGSTVEAWVTGEQHRAGHDHAPIGYAPGEPVPLGDAVYAGVNDYEGVYATIFAGM